jgi:protein-disulfide isomerase
MSNCSLRLCRLAIATAALVLASLPQPAPAADQFTPTQRAEFVHILREALKNDPSILRDAIEAVKTSEARNAIETHRAALVRPEDPVAGNKTGRVTIIEFYDTRCPYCRAMEPVMAELLAEHHEVRLIYKDLPVLGPASVLAARALLAAQKQDGYERLRTALMRMQQDYTQDQIMAEARKLGLDTARLYQDMNDPAIKARLDANVRLAQDLNIDGTPALIIGDQLVPGAMELADLEKAVAAAQR